jgi:hypothetical protein
MARANNYLFKRKGSQNWQLKLQYPGALAEVVGHKRIEKSLGTPDRAAAELIALPAIQEHKWKLLHARRDFALTWQYELEPGREHIGPDGGRIIATERELIYLDADGVIAKRVPNSGFLVPLPSLALQRDAVRREELRRRAAPTSDDAIIDTYVEHANVRGYCEREARATWDTFKLLTQAKPLREATRDDGRKLVEHFRQRGRKRATIAKKIGWLRAAVNLAISENKLKFNPFTNVVPKSKDQQRRLPLSEADMAMARQHLDWLGAEDHCCSEHWPPPECACRKLSRSTGNSGKARAGT